MDHSVPLIAIWERLFNHYGEQSWWPGDSPFEVMVGAILTQNTAWTNVEKAIANLENARLLDAARIASASHPGLADLLRPSGYFNIKAKRLQNYSRWYIQEGELTALRQWPTSGLRDALLTVNGVGPETADDILLYAFERPVFVIDAYTRRIFSRLGLVDESEPYEIMRRSFEHQLGNDVCLASGFTQTQLFNEYHALIVIHAKDVCKKKPDCEHCCLKDLCKF